MSVSCADFTSDITSALKIEAPDGTPESDILNVELGMCLEEIGRLQRADQLVKDLLEWASHTGGWDAEVWKRARSWRDGPLLFNCCTEYAEPDWSRFKSLEVSGCIVGDGGVTTGGIPDDKAEFWTVYARDRDGMAEAITDTKLREAGGSRADADAIASELSQLSGLEVL